MATQLYKYYQLVGADEEWVPIQADQSLDTLRPTFVTALAVDTLFDKSTPKEVVIKAKYQGPMYFDLDAEDIADSITGAKDLWKKLKDHDLTAEDVLIYLSGKKGLHFLIPEKCFVERPAPTMGLVSMYKEMAFALAVDTLDFRVYTAKRGRQFRTCYNVRENGNYKVPITAAELEELTPESYQALCKTPRVVNGHNPQWRGKFALLFDQAFQKISKLKPKVLKPVSKAVLQQQLPIFKKLAAGEIQAEGGFNVIAMQLCLYGREMGWTEDQLVSTCAGVINNHGSDGIRYNSPRKRERELRRMFWYLDDNPSFEYSVQGIKACLPMGPAAKPAPAAAPDDAPWEGPVEDYAPDDEDNLEVDDTEFGGVYRGVTAYMASKGEDGDVAITNFILKNVWLLRSLEFGTITTIKADVFVKGRKVDEAHLSPNIFTGGTSLQNAIAAFGGSFSGTDIHARGVYQAMLREVSKDVYVLDSEGINVFALGSDLTKEYVVWADRDGVKAADGATPPVTFQGFPDTRGVYRTDLLTAPTMAELREQDPGMNRLVKCVKSFCKAHTPDVMGRMIGWAVACYFAPLFQKEFGRFPILHVYGPSGNGKCLAKDTPVILASGKTVLVQDIKVGDQLLSPYGVKQEVLSLARGREAMYRVTPVKGDSYTVNASHILSLRRSGPDGVHLSNGTYIDKTVDVLNVEVAEYAKNPNLRRLFKGWRVDTPIEFHREAEVLPVAPYLLGAWLGDGTSRVTTITKPLCKMIERCNELARSMGCVVNHSPKDKWNRCDSWAYTTVPGLENPLRTALRNLGVLQEKSEAESRKRIPDCYKFGSVEVRKQLLAGLLDSDGALNCGGFDFTSKFKHLSDDVAFIARSLGLAAYVSETVKSVKSSGFSGTYYRVIISGNCSMIPTLDKRAAERRQAKRVTVTGLSVEALPEDDYYGFQIGGDHLFLLGDFTVTHNTDTIRGLLRFFYVNAEPLETTPTSSAFAFQQMLAGSGSIPLFLDEFKPHRMTAEKLEQFRAIFRDLYNAKSVQRGGGSKNVKDNFNALSTLKLQAPLVFAAEAPETETAVVERSVMVSFRRLSGRQAVEARKNALEVYADPAPLAALGLEIASKIVAANNSKATLVKFGKSLEWANDTFLPAADDWEKVERGEMTQEKMRSRAAMRPRPVFNNTVSFFGLQILKMVLVEQLGSERFQAEFDDLFKDMGRSCYLGMEALAEATLPEFVKVLSVFADMTKLPQGDPFALVEDLDYNLTELGGKPVLVLACAQAYRKYRAYMRSTGIAPLYPSEDSFQFAMREIPQFIKQSNGTKRLSTPTTVFDLEELYRSSVLSWKGKATEVKI